MRLPLPLPMTTTGLSDNKNLKRNAKRETQRSSYVMAAGTSSWRDPATACDGGALVGGIGRNVVRHIGGVPCAVRALCEKLAVLHHREFGKFRRLKGRH